MNATVSRRERRQTCTKTQSILSVPSLIPRGATKQLHRCECIVDTSVSRAENSMGTPASPKIRQSVSRVLRAEYWSNLNKP